MKRNEPGAAAPPAREGLEPGRTPRHYGRSDREERPGGVRNRCADVVRRVREDDVRVAHACEYQPLAARTGEVSRRDGPGREARLYAPVPGLERATCGDVVVDCLLVGRLRVLAAPVDAGV